MKKRNEKGLVTLRHWSLFLVVILTATAAFISGVSASKSNDSQEKIKELQHQQIDIQNCANYAIISVVKSLNERTSLTSKLSKADAAQNQAFADLVSAALAKPPPTKSQSRKIVKDFSKKLNHYLNLNKRQRDRQQANPFPKKTELNTCIKDAKEGK